MQPRVQCRTRGRSRRAWVADITGWRRGLHGCRPSTVGVCAGSWQWTMIQRHLLCRPFRLSGRRARGLPPVWLASLAWLGGSPGSAGQPGQASGLAPGYRATQVIRAMPRERRQPSTQPPMSRRRGGGPLPSTILSKAPCPLSFLCLPLLPLTLPLIHPQ